MGLGLPPNDVVPHHIEIPQTPDLLAKPPCFLVEPGHFRTSQHRGEDAESTAQAPQANPQLVRPFWIGKLPNHHHVRGDLIEAFAKDVARRLLGDLSRIKRDRLGVPGRERWVDALPFRKQVASIRLGKPREP